MTLWQPNLAGIPADVWPSITSTQEAREIIPSLSKTSRILKRRTDKDYLERLCRQHIKLTEIENYLDTQPDQFGVMSTSTTSPGNGYRYFRILSRDLSVGNIYIVTSTLATFNVGLDGKSHSLKYDTNTNSSGQLTKMFLPLGAIKDGIRYIIRSQKEDDIWSFIQFDLVSLYNILQNRLGCVRRSSIYPRERTLEIFNLYYADYKKSLQPQTVYTIWKTFDMHQYVMMNAAILGILERSSVRVSAVIDDKGNMEGVPGWIKDKFSDDLKRLQKEIEELAPLIREAIGELQ